MSGRVPFGPLVDKDGKPTDAFRLFLQGLSDASGGAAFSIQTERLSDTEIRFRMRGADGVVRVSTPITLS